jgi:hypothetical protein
VPRKLFAAAAVAAAVAVSGGSTALGDGDPASDTLIIQNAYLPYPAPGKSASAALTRQIAAAYARGYRVKVAVIATKVDLGAVPALFNRPTEYAKFLGQELDLYYVGPLLIAMPAGFGVYDGGRSTTAEEAVLARLKTDGSSSDALTESAATAVEHLLKARALVSTDIRAPYAQPVDSVGRRGTTMKLRYAVLDDSGRAKVLLQVVAAGRAVASLRVPLRLVKPTATYSVPWRVPTTLRGKPQLCVTATDAAGNRSQKSCALLRLA